MAKKMSVEDFESDGFVVYHQKDKEKVKDVVPMKPSKVIIMDNKDVLNAVKESNEALRTGLEQLVYSMETKPDSFTLDIQRDSRGFMQSIKVKVNK